MNAYLLSLFDILSILFFLNAYIYGRMVILLRKGIIVPLRAERRKLIASRIYVQACVYGKIYYVYIN